MAYFSNGTEGEVFNEECSSCRYGKEACPIAYVQMNWNYDACNNKTARGILDHLVKNNGECAMKEFTGNFEKEFEGTLVSHQEIAGLYDKG